MRLDELLNEGMDIWIPDAEKNKIKKECTTCDGKGHTTYGGDKEECWDCYGKGEVEMPDVDYPPMHLSNSNAVAVMNALGYPPNEDYYYEIEPQDIPDIKRAIMKYLNNDDALASHTRDTSDTKGEERWGKTTGDDGVTHIKKTGGARMIDFGVNADYFKRIFDALMPMLDHAQKNKMNISVG
jgi:hypothetical protein